MNSEVREKYLVPVKLGINHQRRQKTMLILTRKSGESITIGDDVKVTVVEVKGKQVRIGIDAPRSYTIHREEVYISIQEENRRAAKESPLSLAGLKHLFGKH